MKMANKRKLIEKIIRSSLQSLYESLDEKGRLGLLFEGGVTDLACYVIDGGHSFKTAILYDPVILLRHLDIIIDQLKAYNNAAIILQNLVLKGIVKIGKFDNWDGKCNNAWSIAAIAGPGYGRDYLYPIAFGLSPTGKLTSDRSIVKSGARKNWRRMYLGDKSATKEPFDDKDNPKTPPPEDDCKLHVDKVKINPKTGEKEIENVDQLNFSYEANGEEKNLLRMLSARHDEVVEEIIQKLDNMDNWDHSDQKEDIMSLLLNRAFYEAADQFFDEHYDNAVD